MNHVVAVPVGAKEDARPSSILGPVKRKLLDTLPVFSSVDVHDLNYKGFAYFLAIGNLILYMTIFSYLTATGSSTEVQRKFLAVTPPARGTANCASVPLSSTGMFQADIHGTWDTRYSFMPNSSIYKISMVGTTVTLEQYSQTIQLLASRVKAAGDMAAGDPFSTLVGWIFFFANDVNTQMAFSTTADIKALSNTFDLDFGGYPTFASSYGICAPTQLPNYKSATSTLTFVLSLIPSTSPSLKPTNPCKGQLEINSLGGTFGLKTPLQAGEGFKITFSLLQLTWAWAINFGIIPFSAQRLVSSGSTSIGALSGVVMETFVSHTAPSIGTLRCYSMKSKPRVCLPQAMPPDAADVVTEYQNGLVYPVFFSSGSSSVYSACSSAASIIKDSQCYTGGVTTMGLFYSRNIAGIAGTNFGADSLLSFAWNMQQSFIDKGTSVTKKQLSDLVLSANYLVNHFSEPPLNQAQLNAKIAALSNAGDIGILTKQMKSADIYTPFNGQSLSLSSLPGFSQLTPNEFYNSSLPIGSINTGNNTLIVQRALAQLAAQPPISVVQPYLQCHSTLSQAVITSAGVASGNASAISGLFLSLSVALMVLYLNIFSEQKIRRPATKILDAETKLKDLERELECIKADRKRDCLEREELRRLVIRLVGDPTPAALISQNARAPVPSFVSHSGISSPDPFPSQRLSQAFGENPMVRASAGSRTSQGKRLSSR